MKVLKNILENYTHYLTDDNTNRWEVVEVSDLEDIIKEYNDANSKEAEMLEALKKYKIVFEKLGAYDRSQEIESIIEELK